MTTHLPIKCRKAFEDHFGQRGWSLRRVTAWEHSLYVDKEVTAFWLGWKAAWDHQHPMPEQCIQTDHTQREIPLAELSSIINEKMSNWLDGVGVKIGGKYNDEAAARLFLAMNISQAVKPYLRTTEPVSVSLEKCEIRVGELCCLSEEKCRDIAKAVLDAAGVKYVD